MAEITYTIEKSFESIEHKCEEWDRLIVETCSNIYMSFDWCRVWWDYYGEGCELRLFLFWDGDTLTGIVPMYIDRVWIGPVWLKAARLLGSNLPPKISDPPVNGDYAGKIFDKVLVSLIKDDGCDAVHFGPLSGEYDSDIMMRKISEKRSDMINAAIDIRDIPHTVFTIPDNYEDYLKSLSKSERTLCKRKFKKVEKSFTVETDVIDDDELLESEFINFKRMHAGQWKREGKPGHFGAWPKAEEFNLALVKTLGKLGRVRLIRLSADGHVILYQYAFALGGSYYWRLPAREIGNEYDQLSLGLVGMVVMIKAAINEGMDTIEGGLGHYEYKTKLGAREYMAHTVLFTANRIGVRFRCRIFGLMADMINIFYYKIWIARILPRIGQRKKPFWKTWIRSNF